MRYVFADCRWSLDDPAWGRAQYLAGHIDECLRLKPPALWLQDGVVDEVAAERARQAGIFTVMDRCLFRDRAALR